MKTQTARLVDGTPVELKANETGFIGTFFLTFNGGRNGWVRSSWDSRGRNKNKRSGQLSIDLETLDIA